MSRSKIPLRFTDSNQALFAKMSGCELQEELHGLKRGGYQHPEAEHILP